MALGHVCPDRIGLSRGEEIEVDRVTRRGDGGQDVMAVHPLSARHAQRGECERVESGCQKANGAVVSEVLVHEECFGSGGS